MKTSQVGIDLIKSFEGYHTKLKDGRCKAYLDKLVRPALRSKGYPGLWTIGYGSTGPHVTEGTIWTQKQAEDDLKRLVASHEKAVLKHVKVPLNQNQFDALVSLSYNLGIHKARSLLGKLNRGDYAGAADAFRLYNKAGGKTIRGLVRRRNAERSLFLTPGPMTAPKPTLKPKEVIENSRKLTLLQRLRLLIVGSGITSAVLWEQFEQVVQFAQANVPWIILGIGVAVWIVFKIVENKSLKDYKEGRYVPSGAA